ncbi:lasso peptide biosynthesis PqqD family chaperone [Paenibacillus alkalitolerans]|uniref:lasso peptide biosynthesis PqqD family chaperone n=1 Tax=Paenibacillus alkalitolerans TaxID=2799335 RepID=UPI0018F64C8E|nr:lasso peptide biosynthesis PqqD family chaperone [Paenibacillus alkalitolerans]
MNNLRVSLNDTIFQSSGYLVSDMDGDKVMMSVQTGKYYNLGKVGGRIWGLAASPIAVSQIVDTLVSEYEVERELCERQVLSFVTKLYKESLIQLEEAVSA